MREQITGLLITFEGGEGCGKTTQLRLIADYLKDLGVPVVCTREPGGSPIADKIRGLILNPENNNLDYRAEFFLFMAARAQHVQDVIAPAMTNGLVILCDRYYDSTWVYQCFARQAIDTDEFFRINELAITYASIAFEPDLTLLLDVDRQIGMKRVASRYVRTRDDSESRIDAEAAAFHTQVNEGYRKLAKLNDRIVTVDANPGIETVQTDLKRVITSYLTTKGFL